MTEASPVKGGRAWMVGMMGSGKSTVGRLVAELAGWTFVDTDRAIEAERGASVAELFEREGEEAFRGYETAAIATVAARPGPLVASVGGGAPLRVANREIMSGSGVVVWLRASADTLTRRLGRGEGRPVLIQRGDEPLRAKVERLLSQREPAYAEAADVTVDVDHRSVHTVARTVLQYLDGC